MSAVPGRRTFVRNVIAGVPAVAGAAVLSPTVHALGILPARVPFAPHAGVDGALHRLAGLHNDLVRRRPTVADARVAAGHLRDLIGYRLESNGDAALPAVFRNLISRHGYEAVITARPDWTIVQTGLAQYGLNAASVQFGTPSREARATALEVLTRRGATSFYVDQLVMFLTFSEMVDDDSELCEELEDLSLIMEAAAAVLCGATVWFPPLAPECVSASMVVALLNILQVLHNC